MTSNTLYLKYRPQNFNEVIGQNEVVKFLQKSIQEKKVAHSYLFFGDRGTGKTSVARIFAKELGVNQDDIYEIDAASNRGISEIREIRESVDILPYKSKYKIYIIDEAHMLTKEAFNALLKTLEEPPKHVIFILATTEKEKILPTILSRCQVLNFESPNLEKLQELIKKVLEKENREADDEVIKKIALTGNGSYRDTLSFLQQVLTIIDGKINLEKFNEVFNFNEVNLLKDFLLAFDEKNKEKVFEIYKHILEKKNDLNVFLNDVIEILRKNLLVRNSKSFVLEEKEKWILDLKLNSKVLLYFLDLEEKIKNSHRPEIFLEVYLIDYFDKT